MGAAGPRDRPTSRRPLPVLSDIPNDRMLRWDEIERRRSASSAIRPATPTATPSTARDGCVSCEHGGRRVSRTEHDGSITVLADSYDGKRLNSPNDVVVKSDGSIWFTDPAYGIESDYEGHQAESEIGGCHVYRVDPATGDVRVVADDFVRPNGLAFSPDETPALHRPTPARSADGTSGVFNVDDDGTLSGGEVFATCTAGFFDGFRLDDDGPHLGQRRRRRPLLRPRRHADRQGLRARGRRQRRVRRRQAQPPLHLRHDVALLGHAAGQRCDPKLDVMDVPSSTTPST